MEALVLSILNENENGTYPYEISSILGKSLNSSDSIIYSICSRMEREGLIVQGEVPCIVKGRMRKYYYITKRGRDCLKQLKEMYCSQKTFLDKWLNIQV